MTIQVPKQRHVTGHAASGDMKINEIITEGAFKKSAEHAIPDMQVFDDLDNQNPYHMYRFGLALAAAPGPTDSEYGPTGSNLVTVAYSDADTDKINAAKRIMGRTSTGITKVDSQEMPGINKQSPVQPRGPVKRKNK